MIDYKSINCNKLLHDDAKLSIISAMLGVIPKNLRALGIEFDGDNVVFVAIYDCDPTDADFDAISVAIAEATTHFEVIVPPAVLDKYITVNFPEDLTPYCPNWGWVYLRNEAEV